MDQGSPRALKFIVIGLAVLMVAMSAAIVWGVARGPRNSGPVWTRALGLPAGHAIVSMVPVGDFLALHVNAGAGREERVIIVDPRNGRIDGTIQGQGTP